MERLDIPYASIKTVFLDMGNTLMSIDFSWVRRELEARGIPCSLDELRRAEAAARPMVSAELEHLGGTEGDSTFRFYLGCTISRLGCRVAESRRNEVRDELVATLRAAETSELWSYVLPGVRDALSRLRRRGLRLAVVSNSDGTVEATLAEQGLRPFFETVVDSRVVGYEKPDPRLFHHALAVCGASPEQTLHVGDLYHADVVGARAAGVHAVLIDPFDDWDGVDCPRVPDLGGLAERFELSGD